MKEQPPIENQESKEITLPIAEKLFNSEMKTFEEGILPEIEREPDLLKKQKMMKNLETAFFSSLIALGVVSKSVDQQVEKSAEQILEKLKRLK